MNFTSADIKALFAPAAIALLLGVSGAALIWYINLQVAGADIRLAGARKDRIQAQERLDRISEEEREVKERIEVYRQLRLLHVIGKERRLEWVDAIQHIRVSREMLDVRYRIEPQKQLVSIPGKPGNIDFYSSTMKVELALLHEGDLLAFLSDLRNAGNAYVAIRRCTVSRSGFSPPPPGAPTLTPRLQAECVIDLITVLDAGAKT